MKDLKLFLGGVRLLCPLCLLALTFYYIILLCSILIYLCSYDIYTHLIYFVIYIHAQDCSYIHRLYFVFMPFLCWHLIILIYLFLMLFIYILVTLLFIFMTTTIHTFIDFIPSSCYSYTIISSYLFTFLISVSIIGIHSFVQTFTFFFLFM